MSPVWLNVVSDWVMGLGGLVVPGTIRESLFILVAIHNLDVPERPEVVITDTASYSDVVFGLFAICGYQFSPRIADITDTRLWRIDPKTRYGALEELGRHLVRLGKVRDSWGDGRYPMPRPDLAGELRPLRDPNGGDE